MRSDQNAGPLLFMMIIRSKVCINLILVFCLWADVSFGDEKPITYTVDFSYNYQWFNVNSGKMLVENRVGCKVSVDGEKILIEPYSLSGATNVVFHIWATSPFSSKEWIIGGETMSPTDTIKNIWLDNKPTRSCSDLAANLGRILYVPGGHAVFNGLSENDRYYLDLESGSYVASELRMSYSKVKWNGSDVCNEIVAYSPEYYRQMVSATQFKTNLFKGDHLGRKLWALSLLSFTNWNGYVFPSKFKYVRYRDVNQRVDVENLDPVVVCDGDITYIKKGANVNVASRLSTNLFISDFRFKDVPESGRAVGYMSSPGNWPVYQSKEFNELVATNQAVAAIKSNQIFRARARFIIVLIFSVMLIAPVLFLGNKYLRND